MTRAAVYVRISKDSEATGLGVERQRQDCLRLLERHGWSLAQTYCDNDVSATKGGRLTYGAQRPQFEAMMQDVQAGRLDAIVVWDLDRLTRTPRETEDIIQLADDTGLALASVGGEVDLGKPQGRMGLRGWPGHCAGAGAQSPGHGRDVLAEPRRQLRRRTTH